MSESNAADIVRRAGVRELHGSARAAMRSRMKFLNPEVSFDRRTSSVMPGDQVQLRIPLSLLALKFITRCEHGDNLDRSAVLSSVNSIARDRFRIDHTTVQIEEAAALAEMFDSCNCHFGAWDSSIPPGR